MDEILDASGLEVFCAGRCSGYYVEGTAVQILEGGDGVLGILVVARADDYDVGTSLERLVDTFLDGSEAQVVYHLVTGSSQEVARELGTGLTHSQIADGEHEGNGHLLGLLGSEAQRLEVGSQTGRLEGCNLALLGTAAATGSRLLALALL